MPYSYVVTQIPAGLVLAKLPAAVFLSGAVMAWGIVSLACGFANSFAVMTVLRFLVGVCEAPFFPGALLILSR
jgi:MFS family permease